MTYVNSLFSVENKVVLITGSAQGIGKTIAESLLKANSKVILVDKSEKNLKKTFQEFKKQYQNVFSLTVDITRLSGIKKIHQYIEKKFGNLDVLINNAGITKPNNFSTYPDKFWNETYEVNLKSIFYLSKELSKLMIKQKSGSIINITSINAELAFPSNPSYVTFKGGLKQLTKSLALELGKYQIRANNVGPGYFRTDMTKKSWNSLKTRKKIREKTCLNRWGTPDDLIGIIFLLSSESSSYITGQDFYVDGGWLARGL